MDDIKIKRIKKLISEFPKSDIHTSYQDYRWNTYCYSDSNISEWIKKLRSILDECTYKCDSCKNMFFPLDMFATYYWRKVSELKPEEWKKVKEEYYRDYEIVESRGYDHGLVCLECKTTKKDR